MKRQRRQRGCARLERPAEQAPEAGLEPPESRVEASTATELLKALDRPTVFRIVAEAIHSLAGGAVVAMSEFEPSLRKVTLRRLECTPSEHRQLASTLGRDPVGLSLELPDEERRSWTPGELAPVGLAALFFGQVSAEICERLERELGLGDAFRMAAAYEDDLLATVMVVTRSRGPLPHRRSIEALVAQAGLALQRLRAEEASHRMEERLRALVMASTGSVYRFSPDWQEMLQLEGRDFLADTVGPLRAWMEKYIPADEQPRLAATVREAIRTKGVFALEHKVWRADGSVGWTFSRAVPVLGSNGEIAEWFGSATDITERIRSEEALRRSEGILSFSLDAAKAGAWDLNLVDHTSHRSLRHDRIFGYETPLPEWTYEMFLEHVLPEDRAEVDRSFRRALETHGDWSFETRIRRRDGRIRWIWAAGRHQFDESGRPTRMVGLVQDISERKRGEAILREREARFRALIENIEVGITLIDASGRFTLVNRQFLAMFGLSDDEDVHNVNSRDWSAWQVFDESGHLLDVDEHPVRKAARTGQIVRSQLVRVRPPGSEDDVWMVLGATPLLGEDGQIVICSYQDVTALKHTEMALRRSEEALRVANEHLVEADQNKNHFMAMLSHELRNPLAPIRNSLFVLDHVPPGGDQARRALAVLTRQVGQLARLVDDLLDVTRIARNKISLQRQRLELSELVRRSLEDHRALFEQAGLQVRFEPAAAPVPVDADWNRLAQVLGNLLQNAAKFTPRDGQVRVRVGVERPEGRAVIDVVDTGIGMSTQMLSQIFVPFSQADSGLARSKGGLGLGLSLARGLVALHGGEMSAWSAGLGKGSTLTVRLPLAPELRPNAEAGPAARPRRRRVLIIEDGADAADSLHGVLEPGDDEVEVAHGGSEGLAKAHAFQPDVVLCDLGLPGMDGYAVARAFRSDEALRRTRLIALSGDDQPEDQRRAAEAGFDLQLARPSAPQKLESILSHSTIH